MNIFILDSDPVAAAQMQCDKHVVKMILETAQMLCSPFEPETAPYKRTHYNHPCSVWARQSLENYKWLCEHGLALLDEYKFRYGKTHKSGSVIIWCIDNTSILDLPNVGLMPFALAMPEEYKTDHAVNSYRCYYLNEKYEFAKWTKRSKPDWWIEENGDVG